MNAKIRGLCEIKSEKIAQLDKITNAAKELRSKIHKSVLEEKTLKMHIPDQDLREILDKIEEWIKRIEYLEMKEKLKKT